MPFASPAAAGLTEKLVDCLAEFCCSITLLGDRRIELQNCRVPVGRPARLSALHYVRAGKLAPVSAAVWALKLLVILAVTCRHLVANRKNIDVVICFLGTYYAPVLLTARLLGKPTISFEPGNDIPAVRSTYANRCLTGLLLAFMRSLQRINHELATLVVTESPAVIADAGLQAYVARVRTGLLQTDMELCRPRVPIQQRPEAIIFVGRLLPVKGVAELIAALALLRDRRLQALVVGDGPLREALLQSVVKHHLKGVEFVGWAPRSQVAELLNSARVLVLPSFGEGMPNVIVEAMASGTPVVATDVGGVGDLIVDGDNGYLIADASPQTIAEGIVRALEDPNLAAVSARARTDAVRRHSLQAVALGWRAIVLEAIDGG
jgi:glycosyltransferase involved in cell wall biosynthesis